LKNLLLKYDQKNRHTLGATAEIFIYILRNLIKGVLGKLLITRKYREEDGTKGSDNVRFIFSWDMQVASYRQYSADEKYHTDLERSKGGGGGKVVSFLEGLSQICENRISFAMSTRLSVRMEQLGSH